MFRNENYPLSGLAPPRAIPSKSSGILLGTKTAPIHPWWHFNRILASVLYELDKGLFYSRQARANHPAIGASVSPFLVFLGSVVF